MGAGSFFSSGAAFWRCSSLLRVFFWALAAVASAASRIPTAVMACNAPGRMGFAFTLARKRGVRSATRVANAVDRAVRSVATASLCAFSRTWPTSTGLGMRGPVVWSRAA